MEEVQQSTEALKPAGPRVCVIIPSFHRGAMLRKCLDSITRAEALAAVQVIVLDIGTYDTTPAYDLDFPAFTFLRMPRNFGATKALNIGIRSAKADLLLFLDPAIEVPPGVITSLANALEQNPDAAAVCPLLTDTAGAPVPQLRALPDRDTLWRLWQDESALTSSPPQSLQTPIPVEYPYRKALLISLPFLKGMNYFDEHYGEFGADLELAFQIRHAGKKTLILPNLRVIDHSASEKELNWSNSQLAILAADRLNGVSHFLGKRAGFFSGLLLQVQAIFTTLLRALTFQSPGYNWSLLMGLLSGVKIDGSQGSL